MTNTDIQKQVMEGCDVNVHGGFRRNWQYKTGTDKTDSAISMVNGGYSMTGDMYHKDTYQNKSGGLINPMPQNNVSTQYKRSNGLLGICAFARSRESVTVSPFQNNKGAGGPMRGGNNPPYRGPAGPGSKIKNGRVCTLNTGPSHYRPKPSGKVHQ